MGNEETTITIPLERYEGLLDTETRTSILVDYIKRNSYADRETMMRILGYPGNADMIRDQEKDLRSSFSLNDATGGITEDVRAD